MSDKCFSLSIKAVIRDEHGRCLRIRRSLSSGYNAGKWDLPGGKVDPGETFDEALLREVEEETGLRIRLTRVAGSAESEAPTRKVAYLIMEGQLISGEIQLSEEHDKSEWVELGKFCDKDLCAQFLPFAEDYVRSATN